MRCALHTEHGDGVPLVLRTLLVFPKQLQENVWGMVVEQESVQVCGTGFDTIMKMVDTMMMHDGLMGWSDEAMSTVEYQFAANAYHKWWIAREGKRRARAEGPLASTPQRWVCSLCGDGMTQHLYGWLHICSSTASSSMSTTEQDSTKS